MIFVEMSDKKKMLLPELEDKAPFGNRMQNFDARFSPITGNPNYHHMHIKSCEFVM